MEQYLMPMSSPDLTEREIEAVTNVLRTPILSIGPRVEAFERGVCEQIGVRHAIAVNSGTAGLHLGVIAAGVQMGDLVITSPFSFVASANAIVYEGGIPIFVDVDPVTGNIDAKKTVEAMTDLMAGGASAARWLPRSMPAPPRALKSVMPVHAFGQPADMDPILDAARQHGLTVIEDACESIASTYRGRQTGTLGDVGVFAFYPNKQMTTGEGGMIVTNRDDWAALFMSLRNQGRDVFDGWLNHTRIGYNYRLDEMSAALGEVQIRRLAELVAKRAKVAAWYNEQLAGIELIETPQVVADTTAMSWFVYVIRVRRPAQRDVVMSELATRGIPSRPYFTPIHVQQCYIDRFACHSDDYPVAAELGDVSLALPFSSVMREADVSRVCENLAEILSGTAALR